MIYAKFMGRFWSLTPREWREMTEEACRNDGAFELPASAELKGRPSNVPAHKIPDLSHWTVMDWENELAELDDTE